MRMLLLLVLVGLVVAAAVWGYQRLRAAAPARAITAADEPLEAPGMLAYGPESGPGRLRLTATQLIFLSASGRILTVERTDILGVSATDELPDRHVARPVLVVTTATGEYFFAVDRVADWEQRLTS